MFSSSMTGLLIRLLCFQKYHIFPLPLIYFPFLFLIDAFHSTTANPISTNQSDDYAENHVNFNPLWFSTFFFLKKKKETI
jgi:hypothetical protein